MPQLLPIGLMLLFGVVSILMLCLVPVVWGIVRSIRSRARVKAAVLGVVAVGIFALSAWMIGAQAPKGARTIAQLKLSDGREFVVRHYRYGWLEYPKVRFYARDANGVWTRFPVIAELVDSRAASLVVNTSAQQVELMSGKYFVSTYVIRNGSYVHVDGSGSDPWELPPGIEPGEEETK